MNKFEEAKNLIDKLSGIITEQSVCTTADAAAHRRHQSYNVHPRYDCSVRPGPSSSSRAIASTSGTISPTGVHADGDTVSHTPYNIHQRLFGYAAGNKRRKGPGKYQSTGKKTAKPVPWSHVFVCLAHTDADRVPNDYSLLNANGLGKVKLALHEESDPMEIHSTIVKTFPKLSVAGGYDLLRTQDNSKQLTVIVAPPEGYTGAYLKSVLGQAKCFIRPIQYDIILEDFPAQAAGTEVSQYSGGIIL